MSSKEELKIVKLAVGSPDLTYDEIAAMLGVTRYRIKAVTSAAGIHRNRGPRKGVQKTVDEPKIVQYMRDNPLECYEAIAVKFGHHRVTIQKIAGQYGLNRATGHKKTSPTIAKGLRLLQENPNLAFVDAAKAIGVSGVTMGHHAHRAGFKRRYGPWGDRIIDREKIISCLTRKPWMTADDIAKECDCATNTVRNIAYRHGIKHSSVRAKMTARALKATLGENFQTLI